MENIHLKILWENHQTNSHYNKDQIELQIRANNIQIQYMEFSVSGNFLPSAMYFLKKSCCLHNKTSL